MYKHKQALLTFLYTKTIIQYNYIVKPPIVDPPRKGHCIINLSIQRTVHGTRKFCFPIVAIQFEPPRKGQPLYKGQSM